MGYGKCFQKHAVYLNHCLANLKGGVADFEVNLKIQSIHNPQKKKQFGCGHRLSGKLFISGGETLKMVHFGKTLKRYTFPFKYFGGFSKKCTVLMVSPKCTVLRISPLEIKGFSRQPVTAAGFFFCGLRIPHGYFDFQIHFKIGNSSL